MRQFPLELYAGKLCGATDDRKRSLSAAPCGLAWSVFPRRFRLLLGLPFALAKVILLACLALRLTVRFSPDLRARTLAVLAPVRLMCHSGQQKGSAAFAALPKFFTRYADNYISIPPSTLIT